MDKGLEAGNHEEGAGCDWIKINLLLFMIDEPKVALLDLSGARTGWIAEYREA